jgi:hypothetical protein
VKEADALIFAATLDPEVLHFGESKPQATLCAWCGQSLPAVDPDVCPHCGALLKPTDETLEVPGVTTLAPEVLRILEVAAEKRRRKAKPRFRSAPDAPGLAVPPATLEPAEEIAALRPPDAEVKRVMRELEAAARRASAPGMASAVQPAVTAAVEPAVEPAIEPSEAPEFPDAPDLPEAEP